MMGRVVVPSTFRVSDRPIGPELAASLMVTITVPSRGPPFTPGDGRLGSRRSSVTPRPGIYAVPGLVSAAVQDAAQVAVCRLSTPSTSFST